MDEAYDKKMVKEVNNRENIDELDLVGVTLYTLVRRIFSKIKERLVAKKAS